jgi:hypothetical protein
MPDAAFLLAQTLHGTSQLRFIEFGLASALKAKIDPDRTLNFMGRDELLEWTSTLKELLSRRGLDLPMKRYR